MTFISYSQNLEDVMLWRALKHVEKGFYVDVGANDPKELSVTRAFYQRGWRGINIDPATYTLLSRDRVRDINLEVAISSTEGEITFYQVSNSALSTSDLELAEHYRQAGHIVNERKVRSWTLSRVLEMYANGPIHFMNIDVEGAELAVLQGLDLSLWRPWIILIEATIPTTTKPDFEEWETIIVSSNYEFVYFDGLNRFYIAREHGELAEAFRLPPNIFDNYVLSGQFENQQELEAKEKVLQVQNVELEAREKVLQAQNVELGAREEVIQAQKSELEAKEKIIHGFQTSYFFWIVNGPFRWFPGIRTITSGLRTLRRFFLPKVGVLDQYPPQPLFIPKSYLAIGNVPASQSLPSISIVTPSYNQGEFIERTVRSVLDQGYPNLEYIVQDGDSKDGTLDVLKSFQQQLTYMDSRQDDGQAHAINLGFQRASGEIMAYLNSDDILLPGTLRYVADYFTRHPEIDVIYGHRVIINEKDEEIGRWVLPPHDNDIILWADYIPQETLFWRRSLWEKIGGHLDESYRFALDWDLIMRFRMAGAKFKRLPRFLGAFRSQAGQKTNLQMSSVGAGEMDRLRKQAHGRDVSWQEIIKNVAPYLRSSIIYHKLYRLGILRY
jgi:FkbM family methyltransferase